MKNEAFATSTNSEDLPSDEHAEIERLAHDTHMPVDLVQQLYTRERAKLERTARIKTYVPVLINRHVRALLKERRAIS